MARRPYVRAWVQKLARDLEDLAELDPARYAEAVRKIDELLAAHRERIGVGDGVRGSQNST